MRSDNQPELIINHTEKIIKSPIAGSEKILNIFNGIEG